MSYQTLKGSSFMAPSNLKKPPSEKLDILDARGLRTGDVLSRKEVHAAGKIHRAVHLYLFDTDKRVLIQKRSLNCDHYPGFWSITLTAHVNAGETSGQSLRRELKEELGIQPGLVDFEFLFSYRRDATLRPDYVDRHIHGVFVGFLTQKAPPLTSPERGSRRGTLCAIQSISRHGERRR
jgi:isopentenyl-diphosphate delta-isomerase